MQNSFAARSIYRPKRQKPLDCEVERLCFVRIAGCSNRLHLAESRGILRAAQVRGSGAIVAKRQADASEGQPKAGDSAAEWVLISDLLPWAKNPRDNKQAILKVAKSVKRFGFGAPLVARLANKFVIAGHTRILGALHPLNKMTIVPVRYLDISQAEAEALALADNKLGEIATWDDAALADVLREIQAADASLLADTGFSEAEIKELIDGPDFQPSGNEPPRLDEKKPTCCPSCGHTWTV